MRTAIKNKAGNYDSGSDSLKITNNEFLAAAGKIYNVTDGRFHTLNEIIAAIGEALGRKLPRFSIPVGPARIVAGMLEDALRLIGRHAPIGRATIDLIRPRGTGPTLTVLFRLPNG